MDKIKTFNVPQILLKIMIKLAYFCLFSLHTILLVSARVNARPLQFISDGVRDDANTPSSSSMIRINSDEMALSSSDECEPLYGFLPCSTNVFGHLFLIVVYEYLLFHGETYVALGGAGIFKILGPGVFGASAFHVIGAFPEALIVLASGLMNTKDEAQEHVHTVVGLLAGTTILQLTLIWGTCVIISKQKLSDHESVVSGSQERRGVVNIVISSLTSSGVSTDKETSYTARIMVVSAIPFLIIQIPKLINSTASTDDVKSIFVLLSLILSLLFLSVYFFYQIFQPWIQERRWELLNSKHIISEILRDVRKDALQKILNNDGSPNVKEIKGLFNEMDEDGDNKLSQYEVKELVDEINKFRRLFSNDDNTIEEVMMNFNIDRDRNLNMDEFMIVITQWLDQNKGSRDKSLKDLHQILGPWIQKKRQDRDATSDLISTVLKHLQSSAIGTLTGQDGTPDVPQIRRLFEKLDRDKNNCISMPELKEAISDLKFGNIAQDGDEDRTAEKLMEELDTSGDRMVSEDEFIVGVSNWLYTSNSNHQHSRNTSPPKPSYRENLEETQDLIATGKHNGCLVWIKATLQLVAGMGILSFLAEPLINSVQRFSKAANLPTFLIGFILVPLATNARGAISAFTESRRKKSRIISLTFSEIYSGVLMNNVMSFSVLLAIIYIRGLEWAYSGELLVVLFVCVALGLVASFRSTYPIWSSLLAFFLYPFSLLMVYILTDVLNYS